MMRYRFIVGSALAVIAVCAGAGVSVYLAPEIGPLLMVVWLGIAMCVGGWIGETAGWRGWLR